MIQYAAALVIEREFPAYWMPGSAGLTTVCGEDAYACAVCLDFASICPIASTTASKVSMVEAWRAL